MSKSWWKSKAIWLSVLLVAGGIGEFLAGVPAGASISTIMAGVLNVIIRVLTTQPISGTPASKK